jgi:hypothetical protein
MIITLPGSYFLERVGVSTRERATIFENCRSLEVRPLVK